MDKPGISIHIFEMYITNNTIKYHLPNFVNIQCIIGVNKTIQIKSLINHIGINNGPVFIFCTPSQLILPAHSSQLQNIFIHPLLEQNSMMSLIFILLLSIILYINAIIFHNKYGINNVFIRLRIFCLYFIALNSVLKKK